LDNEINFDGEGIRMIQSPFDDLDMILCKKCLMTGYEVECYKIQFTTIWWNSKTGSNGENR